MFESLHSYTIEDKTFISYISETELEVIVDSLAGRIRDDYINKNPVFLITLKGAIFFAKELIIRSGIECSIEAIHAKSYGAQMHSSGNVELNMFKVDLENRDVIIIEDIIDSGLTLSKLCEELNKYNPSSVEIVALLSKPDMRKVEIRAKYIGLEIPPIFVIGFGLDFNEKGRHLKKIYALSSD